MTTVDTWLDLIAPGWRAMSTIIVVEVVMSDDPGWWPGGVLAIESEIMQLLCAEVDAARAGVIGDAAARDRLRAHGLEGHTLRGLPS